MIITFLIPVYNEVKTVEDAIREVLELDNIKKEIIIIDNYSTDGSIEIIKKFENVSNVKVILKSKNLGYGDSIKKGFALATGDYIYIQYTDLEYHISGFEIMLKKILKTKSDCVFGERYKINNFFSHIKEIINRPAYLGTLLTTCLINIFYDKNFNDIIGGKLYKSSKIKSIKIDSNYAGFDFELVSKIIKNNFKVEKTLVPYKPRENSSEKKIKFYNMFNAVYEIFRVKFFK
jgi:dolichol-phosphate mannosyltransferase